VGAEHDERHQGHRGLRGQREHEVGERLDHEPDPHHVGQGEPALQAAVRGRAHEAADGHRGRQQPEADVAHPQALLRVEHQHSPRRPERDVEGQDRERQRSHRWVADQPAEALEHLPPDARTATFGEGRADVEHDLADEDHAQPVADRIGRERDRRPIANRSALNGGSSSWLVSRNAPHPRVGDAEVAAGDEVRDHRAARRSRRRSPPSRAVNRASSTTAMPTEPVTMVAASTVSTRTRPRLRR
jgi:hypothetical protein